MMKVQWTAMDYNFVPFLISSNKIQIYHIKYESHSSPLSMGMLVQNRDRAELSRAEKKILILILILMNIKIRYVE